MIEKYDLKELLEKYKIAPNKLIENNKLCNYGEYKQIDDTLDYLINELKISQKNIEKCPSILYFSADNIKINFIFLKDKKIKFTSIETCLHVLSTESNMLKETYDYVENKYGIDAINKITSILNIDVEKIKGIEKLNIPFSNKNDVLSASIGRNDVKDIQDMINSEEFKNTQNYLHLKL